ncbi:MAG: aminotransferase class V-fold PLP-dependent enzyme [Streptomycetaceae bacterium]|jgi:arginine decarboxylase|nr:MAG: aminotransferase class V-fold PLP-dependent enzyme [Streptomycetaceae bacterium]
MSSLRVSAPLLDAYLSYFESKRTPFTIPGHKQRASRLDAGLGQVVDSDTPLYGGLDEIKLTHQVLRKAESLAATLWNADYARFSTGGSTHANQAIILALGKPGDKVALSRTAHRSVLSALVLAGLEPIWLSPDIDAATGVPIGISVQEFEKILHQNPIALLLTEPGYLGTLSDLSALITSAHSLSIPVIVDAAWGGHFGFSQSVPAHCLALGADALITSTHKALPGYSASAILLAQGKYLNLDRIEQSFETTHTTSPAGAPLASIDGCRALLQTRGEELIQELVTNVEKFKSDVQSNFEIPIFLNTSDFPLGRFDPTKIVLRANQLGASGVEIEKTLQLSNIRVEMADSDTVVFLATLADSTPEFDELADTLTPILKALATSPRASATSLSWSVLPQVGVSMRQAYFADTEMVVAADATGRISADLIAPYPPGVAVVAPGEVLTSTIIEGLATTKAAGIRIAYATDPTLSTYRVVKS